VHPLDIVNRLHGSTGCEIGAEVETSGADADQITGLQREVGVGLHADHPLRNVPQRLPGPPTATPAALAAEPGVRTGDGIIGEADVAVFLSTDRQPADAAGGIQLDRT
jgi:hypothetical protein